MNGGLNLNYSLEYLCFTPESQYLERKSARKKPRELLKARNLYRDGYITKAGILLFGKDYSRFLPQARLKFVRFGGTEMGLGQVQEINDSIIN